MEKETGSPVDPDSVTQRITEYLRGILGVAAPGHSVGNDPVGILIASHRLQRDTMHDAIELIKAFKVTIHNLEKEVAYWKANRE